MINKMLTDIYISVSQLKNCIAYLEDYFKLGKQIFRVIDIFGHLEFRTPKQSPCMIYSASKERKQIQGRKM